MKNKEIKEEKKDNRALSEKVEDKLDDIMLTTQEAIYGEGGPDDIPVMMDRPNGIKKINKVATRRNFNKKFIFNKTFLKVVGVIFLIGISLSLITFLIGLLF